MINKTNKYLKVKEIQNGYFLTKNDKILAKIILAFMRACVAPQVCATYFNVKTTICVDPTHKKVHFYRLK